MGRMNSYLIGVAEEFRIDAYFEHPTDELVHYLYRLGRFRDLVKRARTHRDLLRLFNWADHQDNPDPYFEALEAYAPKLSAPIMDGPYEKNPS